MYISLQRQERLRELPESREVIPCISGVTDLQEVGRSAEVIGFVGLRDGREVIVEVLRDDTDQEEYFFRSAALQSRLAQAAIPPYLEVGFAEGRPYRVREYVQGRPAQELLTDGPLAEDRLIALARTVAAALKAVHQRGFVFGHLTLDHLRVDRSGVFRLFDAGQCIRIGSPYQYYRRESLAPALVRQTHAPEVQEGEPIKCASDLFSLGCLILDLAVGYPVSPERRERTLEGLELRPSFKYLLGLLLSPIEKRPSASSVLVALLHLEEWDARLRLGQSLPSLPTEEFLHPYPLCGREDEILRLREAWARSREQAHTVFLMGPEESGRSRLAEELRRGLPLREQSRLRVRYETSDEDFDGLTVVIQESCEKDGSAEIVRLEALSSDNAVHLAEAFLNSRIPKALRLELERDDWLPGILLRQLERWCDEGKLRPYWGHWHFGNDASEPEPVKLTAHYQPLEQKTLERFVFSLEELQSASQDPVDQVQSLTRALERVIPCAQSVAWIALESGLTPVSGSPANEDMEFLAEALLQNHPKTSTEPYARLALPIMDGQTVLGGVVLSRANPFLGIEVELAQSLGRQTRMELERARLFGEQQQLLEKTRHRFLTAQIRPHFLFNALNTLAALIPVEPELAENLTLDTATYLRSTFADRPDRVSMAEELELVEVYLRLEKARFGKRLRWRFEVEPACRSVLVPTLTLQPLIENAVRHGVTCLSGGGEITLEVRRSNSDVEVVLSDNGAGFDPDHIRPKGTGVGLSNVRERLMQVYGQRCDWKLQSAVGEGTTIRFCLPFES